MSPHSLSKIVSITSLLTSSLIAETPRVLEAGHTLTLFAEDPDIVTPIGMAIDAQDRVFVLESHTHSPPSDYPGPKSDSVKIFIDENNDGKADRIEVFAEGLDRALNLAFSPDGTLYAICAHELVALPDRDGDGKCDGNKRILKLESNSNNPHGCWLGLAFGNDGKMYISQGHIRKYRVEGKDGSVIESYGEGGIVIRANPDGTELERWATGFWNPFDLAFDHRGDLMLIDNDPDARGPNRLLRVVQGGDYGYKSLYGGDGTHPFQGWDGELPGTLPYLSGTGEAPSGIIDVSTGRIRSYLVTIWNENTIERHTLNDSGPEKTIFMSGGKDFRPVAIKRDSRGNLFLTDWMLVDYPNHGKGRIWRLTNAPLPLPQKTSPPHPEPTRSTIADILRNPDPFTRHSGEMWLAQPAQSALANTLASHADPSVRLGATLSLRRSAAKENVAQIRRALRDPSIAVRRIACLWAAESADLSLRPNLDEVLSAGEVSLPLFEAYLSAAEMLNPPFIEAYLNHNYRPPFKLEPGLLERLAGDAQLPVSVRALSISRLPPSEALPFVASDEPTLRLAAIRNSFREPSPDFRARLLQFALNENENAEVRYESIFALGQLGLEAPSRLAPLLTHPEQDIAIAAARALDSYAADSATRAAFDRLYESTKSNPARQALAESAEYALFGFDTSKPAGLRRPKTVENWEEIAAEGGDPERGSRVFRDAQNLCSHCHSLETSASLLGPNLSGISQSLSRRQIAHAILRPSDSLSPEYQAWAIYLKDGSVQTGVQIDHQKKGEMLLFTTDQKNTRFKGADIKDYRAMPTSLMPLGLENLMTVSEFRDLIAYLSSNS